MKAKHAPDSEDTRIEQTVEPITNALDARASVLVQIYGETIGRRFPLDRPLITIGRDDGNEIVLPFDNVSRHHAELECDAERIILRDKGSTNGTSVNDRPLRRDAFLNSGDLIKIGSTIFKFLSGQDLEVLYFEEIYRMTIIDGLTEIHNKRYLLEFLEREMARCRRYKRALSLIMFDIDHFKHINDTYGHTAGDYVLRTLAQLIAPLVRTEELFARYGGEEFTVILPESDVDRAATFAELIRMLIADTAFTFDLKDFKVSISLGVGSMLDQHKTTTEFIHSVDGALYEAKHGGRNRVERVK